MVKLVLAKSPVAGDSRSKRRGMLAARAPHVTSRMMAGSHRQLLAGLVVGLVALASSASPATAAIQLWIGTGSSEANALANLSQMVLDDLGGGNYEFQGSFDGNYELEIDITTNAPGTSTLADLLTVNTTHRNSGGNVHYLAIEVIGLFDEPVNPGTSGLTLHSQIGLNPSFAEPHGETLGLTSSIRPEGGPSIVEIGPHTSYGDTLSEGFANAVSPFELVSLQQFRVTPNTEFETEARTWVTGSVEDGGPSVVPEPSAVAVWLLAGLSMVGVSVYRRRQRPI